MKSRLSFLLLSGLLAYSHIRPFTLSGDSMRPTVPPGSLLTVDTRPEAFDRVAPGSVVVFKDSRSPAGLTTHKVVAAVKPGTFRAQGDNRQTNPKPDPEPVTRRNFVGLVIAVCLPISPTK